MQGREGAWDEKETPFSELCTHGKIAYKYTLHVVNKNFAVR